MEQQQQQQQQDPPADSSGNKRRRRSLTSFAGVLDVLKRIHQSEPFPVLLSSIAASGSLSWQSVVRPPVGLFVRSFVHSFVRSFVRRSYLLERYDRTRIENGMTERNASPPQFPRKGASRSPLSGPSHSRMREPPTRTPDETPRRVQNDAFSLLTDLFLLRFVVSTSASSSCNESERNETGFAEHAML